MSNKVLLVASREYITRVRKKSFIVMTLLAPLLIVGFYGMIIYLTVSKSGESFKLIYVNDQTGIFVNKFKDSKTMEFTYGPSLPEATQQEELQREKYFAILNIDRPDSAEIERARLIFKEQPGFTTIQYIDAQLNMVKKDLELSKVGITQSTLDKINEHDIRLETIKSTDEGLVSGNSGFSGIVGVILAVGIYLFIFLYGVQVMQGVIEEKTNRIVEVIISSVKPFQLMLGKILGVSLVGLTQFLIWALIVLVLGGSVSAFVFSNIEIPQAEMGTALKDSGLGDITGSFNSLNYPFIFGMFLFYFLAGYLFYGSLFAAIGSAIDNETDKQQFMLPVTLPLVFAFAVAQTKVVTDPNSTLAIWLSIIPFTSPVVMMVRIPFGVPLWEILLSATLMLGGILGTVWLASRIYRIGILMYGKKPTYRELGKWLFYKG